MTGIQSPPLVTSTRPAAPLTDTFSCSGEVPGYALNCVGSAKAGYETITGQFAIGTKLCAEPRVDPLLTVTYAYLEKGVVTQAISGPFDLGRPAAASPTPLGRHPPEPEAAPTVKKKAKKAKQQGKKSTRTRRSSAPRQARR